MTRKVKRNILLIVLLLGIAGAAIGYKIWNKPFTDALSGDAINITAEQLLTDFTKDEASARKKYVPESVGDKILEVTGEVKEASLNDAGENVYILKAGSEMSGIKCVMEKEKDVATAKAGDKIKIRGFCNGYLADEMIPDMAEVILNRCKIVKD